MKNRKNFGTLTCVRYLRMISKIEGILTKTGYVKKLLFWVFVANHFDLTCFCRTVLFSSLHIWELDWVVLKLAILYSEGTPVLKGCVPLPVLVFFYLTTCCKKPLNCSCHLHFVEQQKEIRNRNHSSCFGTLCCCRCLWKAVNALKHFCSFVVCKHT